MAEVVIPKTFANNFWGQDDIGYHVLTSKMNNSKRTFDDLKTFYSTLANLHEEFGRKLLKYLKNELGRDETGTLGNLLDSAHKELDFTAKSHLDLANKIKVNLELSLDNFILEQKDQRKLIQTNVDKAHRNKQLHETHVAKAKEKYENECARQIKIENRIPSVGLRESERLKIKLEKCIHDVNTFEQEYKSACIKLADTTTKWDKGWEVACDKFQEMEEKRIEFIHHSFSIYVNILSTSTNQNQESYERFWKFLDQCNPQKDIDTFIDEKGTGGLIPDPPLFVHYLDDPTKTLRTFRTAKHINNTKVYNDTVSDQSCMSHPILLSNNNVTNNNSNNKQCNILATPHLNAKQHNSKQLPIIKEKDDQSYNEVNLQHMKNIDKNNDETTRFSFSKFSTESNKLHNNNINTIQRNEVQSRNDKNENKNEDDITIDPRAKVIFSIGNNIFQVDNKQSLGKNNLLNQQEFNHHHHQQQQRNLSKKTQWCKRKCINDKDNKKLDETFDLSMKELLQELGVHDINSKNNQHQSINTPKKNEISHIITPDQQIDDQPTLYMQLKQNYLSGRQINNNSLSEKNHVYERNIGINMPYSASPYYYNSEYVYTNEIVTPPNNNHFKD
ncbi:unnamed protein product [Cunninghamella blakesleeana]